MTETLFPLKLVVQDAQTVAEGVKVLFLAAPDGQALPIWEPGAHVEIELPNGLVRQYSLCGDVADRSSWRIAVLREPASRGGSASVHEDLHQGTTVLVRRLRNQFPFEPRAHQIFVAGGIGITPILPMVHACVAEGHSYSLHYSGRSMETLALADELPDGESVHITATGPDGLLDLDQVLAGAPAGTSVYCCGPSGLINALQEKAGASGLDFHCERFTADSNASSVAGDGDAFEVVIASSGETVQVPAGSTILEALEGIGLSVDSNCREGTCGTCELSVLAGEPDHRDEVLDDEERESGETMMICVSRSLTPRLTLDL